MSLLEIILIAISLSMDAFAVSITLGLSAKKIKPGEFLIPGLYFGFFQALMPVIGFFAGIFFTDYIRFLDHWIAFVLLGIIGGKMIKDSFSSDDRPAENTAKETTTAPEEPGDYPFKFTKMLVLALATSIDALAVGITFSFFKINILSAALLIGLTTFVISTCGVKVGRTFGNKFQSKSGFIGGAVLIAIGLKILIEHLFFM
jgi:putative Mn2+ efflux pump MntP